MKKLLLLLLLIPTLLIGQNNPNFIEGKVLSKTSFWQNGNIFTRNMIQTDNGVKPIITRGGIIGLQAEVVSDSPTLKVGSEGRFYMEDDMLLSVESTTVASSLSITSISPTTAPAGEYEVITITGINFGAQNIVRFPDADYGGALFSDALDSQILSWTDTEIQVEVPSFAGTGPIRVVTTGGEIYESPVLTVPFATQALEYDAGSGPQEYQTHHVDINGNGGITWQYNDAVSQIARDDFDAALQTWGCETKINWDIGTDSSVNTITNDGTSIILFSDTVGAGTLGVCTSRFSGCFEDGTIKWYVTELDIIFNANTAWSYGDIPVANQISFKTVATHELGHGRQLGHVIDTNKIMHYSLGANEVNIVLTPDDIAGGMTVHNRSTAAPVCGAPLIADYQNCTLSVVDLDEKDYKIYPIPVRSTLNILGDFDTVKIYDIQGRFLDEFKQNIIPIKYSSGIYLVKVELDNKNLLKRIVVN